jgi:carbamate kinase
MRIVIALGGNALLKRGEPMTAERQRANVRVAAQALARAASDNELVVSHGNGPQVGLLALQGAAYKDVEAYPLDVLGAETQGMIGYLVEQELGNLLPFERPIATLLTMVEVDPDDPAFGDPTKFVGPGYTDADADSLARQRGWSMKRDGTWMRRVVASPRPLQILELRPIQWLIDQGAIVICAGGGGVPTVRSAKDDPDAMGDLLMGVEAVIDKDLASAVLARDLGADVLIIATDVDGVYVDWRSAHERRIACAHPAALDPDAFPAGSMGPKVRAAAQFALETGGTAVIGSLQDIDEMLARRSGTVVSTAIDGIEYASAARAAREPASSSSLT